VQAKHGLTVHTEVHGRIDSPSEPIKAFLFRAAQEILFNAAKYAQVKEVRLRLQRRRGQLWLAVADRGRGFDPQTRIVALSMFEEPGVAQRMRDAGAEIYLPKTGPSDGLLAAIRGKE